MWWYLSLNPLPPHPDLPLHPSASANKELVLLICESVSF